jgi:hypothetical protein
MKKKQITTRLCALCDTRIRSDHVVCKAHFDYYLTHKSEEWMVALIDAQRRQFEIDNQENYIATGIQLPEKRFYRRLSADDLQQINFYREKGLGAKNIGKIIGVNYPAIEKYLQRSKKK